MSKYLDNNGLSYFWGKLKDYFQPKLVSGTNIKTVNSNSLVGSGDVTIHEVPSGGTSGQVLAKNSNTNYDLKWVNQSGGGSYTETDPTVPSWAKASDKPEYYATEIAVEAPVDDDYNNVQEALEGLINGKANTSHAHGNITSGGDITATAPTIASGDQLIINDHSVSKITNGPTFDGSTTNKYLSPKGTWERLPLTLTAIELTQSDYNALSSAQKQLDVLYLINDSIGGGSND